MPESGATGQGAAGHARCGGTTVLTPLQQVYCKIPAPAAKIKRPETTLVLPVLVQIERNISLSVLKYNKIHTQSPVPVSG